MNKSARQIAFEVLLKIEKDEAYSNLAVDSAVKVFNPSSTDCAFISRLVYGVLERTPKSADEISDLTDLPSSAVAVGLTELELLGLIVPASGRRFVIA